MITTKNVKYPLFHISFRGDLDGEWEPKLPDGTDLTKQTKYTETELPRICFSPSIEQCFQAVYPNISFYFETKKFPYMDFYVYQLDTSVKVVTPDILTKERMVHDAHITGEHIAITKSQVNLIGKVRINNTAGCPDLHYHPYDDQKEPRLFLAPHNIQYVFKSL